MSAAYAIPKSAVFVARAYLVLAGCGIAIGSVAMLFMRYELWSPGLDTAVYLYGHALHLHAVAMVLGGVAPAIFGCLGNLFVPEATRAPPSRTVWLGAVAILPWLLAIMLTIAVWLAVPVLAPVGAPIALGLFALSLSLLGIHFAVVALSRLRGTGLGGAMVLVFLAALAWRICDLVREALDVASYGDDLPSYTSVHIVTGSIGASIIPAVAIAVYAGARDVRDAEVPAPVFALWALVPMLGIGLLGASFLATVSSDVYVHDTYMVLGAWNAQWSAVLLALLGGVFAWSAQLVGRHPRQTLARIAIAFVALGTLGTSVAMILLGGSGMPLGYADYLDQFASLHRAIGAGALVTAVGALIAIAAIVAGRSAEPAR